MLRHFPRVLFFAALLYVSLLLVWLLAQPLPELQDFGEWVFQGAAMYSLLDTASALHHQFAWVTFPVPNMLSQLVLMAGNWLVGPFVAAKLLLGMYCIAAPIVCWRAARRFSPAAPMTLFVVLLGVVGLNSCFWHGYINYQIALLLLLLYVELTADRRPGLGMIFAFSMLLFACHASMFAAFVLIVLVREWHRTDRWRVVAALVPSVALLGLYLAKRNHDAAPKHTSYGSLASNLAYKAYTFVKLGPFHNLVIANGASAKRWPVLYGAGVGLNVLFCVCLLAGVVFGIRALVRHHALSFRTVLIWTALAALFLVMPSDLAEVVNLGERFLVLLVALMLLVVPPRLLRATAVLTVVGFALTAAQLPAALLHGADAPEAYHRPTTATAKDFASDGLFSARLFQNDERRIELRDRLSAVAPLLFDTSLLTNR